MKQLLQFITLSLTILFFNGAGLYAQSGFQAKPVTVSRWVDTVNGQVYFVHQVGEGHTLYSISRTYKTAFDKMKKDSPDTQVDIGEFIYIPYVEGLLPAGTRLEKFNGTKPQVMVPEQPAPVAVQEPENVKPEPEPEPVQIQQEETGTIQEDTAAMEIPVPEQAELEEKPHRDVLNVALMLPLYSNRPDNRRAYVYLPFFEGASIAWLELKQPGFFTPAEEDSTAVAQTQTVEPSGADSAAQIRFRLYDLTQNDSILQEILQSEELKETDAVMAAAFATQFPLLNEYSLEHKIPLIHPISERDSLAANNPWFVQLCASFRTQVLSIAEYVKEEFNGHKILIVSDSTPGECRKAAMLNELLPTAEYKIFSADLEKQLREIAEEEKPKEQYLVIPFYAKEITAVKTLLQLRQKKKHITVLAPAVWLEYSTVEFDYLLQNNFCAYASFYKSEKDAGFKEFAKKYFFIYKGIPSMTAYQGYVSFKWLLNELTQYNANFMMHLQRVAEQNPEEPTDIYTPLLRQGLPGFENSWVHFWKLTERGLE